MMTLISFFAVWLVLLYFVIKWVSQGDTRSRLPG